MSLARLGGAAAVLVALAGGPARAQELGAERFFAGTSEEEDDKQSTTYDGSLTSTTFYYRESGSDAPAPAAGGTGPYSASPVDRLFTDMRGQLDADHMGGSKFDFRADLRGRYTTSYTNADGNLVPFQSGTFHGQELEIRELYIRRDGATTDVTVGRQYSLELAATRFDGIKIEPQASQRWKFILFGGLYPSRISRDIREDYPRALVDDPETLGLQEGDPVFSGTAGLGTAYRTQSAYGAFGVVGILPMADDVSTGEAEKPRVFGTANGYWRQSSAVDIYHYVVADATGAGGAGLTNLTLGVNLQPTPRLRAYASVNRIDTETLNVFAQTKLEEPDAMDPQPLVQNNIEVQRIAQESARVGLSANFSNRVEVSTSGALRRRGELRFDYANGDPASRDDDVVFPAAQAADITIALVDRKSVGDMRLAVSGTSSFGVGNANLYRNRALIARVDATKELAQGKAELEGTITYLNSADDNRGTACNISMGFETCYGAAEVQSLTGGALAFYRFRPDWFFISSATVGAQMSQAANSSGKLTTQPSILTTGLLLRLAYRF